MGNSEFQNADNLDRVFFTRRQVVSKCLVIGRRRHNVPPICLCCKIRKAVVVLGRGDNVFHAGLFCEPHPVAGSASYRIVSCGE
jgi:hypothetical protein